MIEGIGVRPPCRALDRGRASSCRELARPRAKLRRTTPRSGLPEGPVSRLPPTAGAGAGLLEPGPGVLVPERLRRHQGGPPGSRRFQQRRVGPALHGTVAARIARRADSALRALLVPVAGQRRSAAPHAIATPDPASLHTPRRRVAPCVDHEHRRRRCSLPRLWRITSTSLPGSRCLSRSPSSPTCSASQSPDTRC